jgi:monomeric sarcosine oxidase
VFGAWTAYHLLRAGKKVVLVDAYGPSNSRASSGGESRIIRMGYGADEIYTRWAMRALTLWQDFFQQAGESLFCRTGVLWMAHEGDRDVQATLATLQKLGVNCQQLSRPQLEKLYPQIAFGQVSWAVLETESGALMARRAVQAVLRETLKAGAAYVQGAVTAPGGQGHVDSVSTSSGESIRAEVFVFACGPWLPKVFPGLLGHRIFPTRQEVFFFGVPAGDARFRSPAMPVWIDFGDEVYGLPDLENRGFKIAFDRHGPHIDPDTEQRFVSASSAAALRDYLGRRFPALKDAPVLETRVCQYENTSNGDFLIDRHPDFENVWLVGGGSGHGFKHGPVVGEYVASQILKGGPTEPRFSLATKQTIEKRSVY